MRSTKSYQGRPKEKWGSGSREMIIDSFDDLDLTVDTSRQVQFGLKVLL
jgi:hypothetical protein